jgi:hypothetical protein
VSELVNSDACPRPTTHLAVVKARVRHVEGVAGAGALVLLAAEPSRGYGKVGLDVLDRPSKASTSGG